MLIDTMFARDMYQVYEINDDLLITYNLNNESCLNVLDGLEPLDLIASTWLGYCQGRPFALTFQPSNVDIFGASSNVYNNR